MSEVGRQVNDTLNNSNNDSAAILSEHNSISNGNNAKDAENKTETKQPDRTKMINNAMTNSDSTLRNDTVMNTSKSSTLNHKLPTDLDNSAIPTAKHTTPSSLSSFTSPTTTSPTTTSPTTTSPTTTSPTPTKPITLAPNTTRNSAHSEPSNERSSKEDSMLTSRLREVFNVCDNQSQGFITVDHFLGLAKDFASSESQTDNKFLSRMVAALESDGSGRISFEDFCKGVQQILLSNKSVLENGDIDQRVIQDFLTGKRLSVDASKSPEIYQTPASPGLFNKNNIKYNNNNNNNINTNNNNNNSTNNKSMFDMLASDKAASNSSEDDVDSGAWSSHDNFWLSSTSPKSKNSNFEATPSPLSNGFPRNDFLGDGFGDNTAFHSNGTYDNGDIDDKGSSYFHRRVHSNNTTPRSSFRSTPGSRNGSFRKTPSSIASQSYRASSIMNCSELLLGVADSHVSELSDKILKLEDNVTSLTEIQKENDDKQLKMKEENALMVERVHVLEDQLREIECMNSDRLNEEQHKHKEILIKTEKDKLNQIELLSRSLNLVESEYHTLKEATPLLKSENERLKKQNFGLEREMATMRQEYTELNDERFNLQETFTTEQATMSQEREARTQLLDDLTQELNELRICKSNLLRSSPSASRTVHPGDFEHSKEQVKHLRKENCELKGQLEETQALMLSRGVEEGQRLIRNTSPFEKSLAFEIEEIPRNELISALQKEQESNAQLKDYIGFITIRILEKNPSILEINKIHDDSK